MPPAERVPIPPLSLASRVCSLDGAEDPSALYDWRGAEARQALEAMLPAEWSFQGKRVLDFGCGAGRTLRHFVEEAQDAEFWGSDIDAPSVAWIQANLSPPLHAQQNRAEPPLGLEYGSFDFVYSLSVFTHLTDNSLPWLVELHRLLKPGGLLIATYMGKEFGEVFTREPWDEDRTGMNVLRRDQGWEHGGPMVLMSDWWITEHWGRAFEVLRSAPVHGQTWVLLRKKDVEVTVEDLAAPSADPREWEALRHNVEQVERDRERDRERTIREVRDHYETSLSWRFTEPARRLSRIARELRARRERDRAG